MCIRDRNTDVLVPYGEGKTLIEELGSERARYDLYYRKELLEQSKPYCAALFQYCLLYTSRQMWAIPIGVSKMGMLTSTRLTIENRPRKLCSSSASMVPKTI